MVRRYSMSSHSTLIERTTSLEYATAETATAQSLRGGWAVAVSDRLKASYGLTVRVADWLVPLAVAVIATVVLALTFLVTIEKV